MLTTHDICEALVELVAESADTLNRDEKLSASGWYVSTENEDDTAISEPYKFLKVEEREDLPPGLSVCVSPVWERDHKRGTNFLAWKKCRVILAAYAVGATDANTGQADPQLVRLFRQGFARAITQLLNNTANQRAIAVPGDENGAFGGRIVSVEYGSAAKPLVGSYWVPCVNVTWEGFFIARESEY